MSTSAQLSTACQTLEASPRQPQWLKKFHPQEVVFTALSLKKLLHHQIWSTGVELHHQATQKLQMLLLNVSLVNLHIVKFSSQWAASKIIIRIAKTGDGLIICQVQVLSIWITIQIARKNGWSLVVKNECSNWESAKITSTKWHSTRTLQNRVISPHPNKWDPSARTNQWLSSRLRFLMRVPLSCQSKMWLASTISMKLNTSMGTGLLQWTSLLVKTWNTLWLLKPFHLVKAAQIAKETKKKNKRSKMIQSDKICYFLKQ